ncbi:MAG: GH3 auxin-responsive promoter family protein [Bacteroidetes bacterium]|nr:GH3 auxin-responsive promoter family protein [Bacteroidota bacterium]
MAIVNSLINWYFKNRLQTLEDSVSNAVAVQKRTLVELIERAKFTEYGKKYGFSSIRDYKDFAGNVPVSSYEDLHPYIERMMKGEQYILWPTEIKWFAKSSGTTNDKSKFIPVSAETIETCHFEGGRDVISVYLKHNPQSNLFSGKGLLIGGSQNINPLNEYSHYGDLSALMIKHLPIWVHLFKTPNSSIALMADWEQKSTKIAEFTVNENVTSISGVPTWTLVLFEKLLKMTGKSNMLEVWPNMELYIHGGVGFNPYREQFKRYFPSDKVKYLETYNASEGFFGIQTDLSQNDMTLMVNYGIFFEFIPMDEFGNSDAKVLPLWDVEIGVNYAVVISTNSGLWRYQLGDTIRFTSTNPFKFYITGRTRLFINAFGEELMIDNADRAMEHACKQTNAILKDYTAAPIYLDDPDNAGHQWLIEFEKEPEDISMFTVALDNRLKELNSDYEAKRHKDVALKMPKVLILPSNSFHKWLEKKNKLGGQNKVPRLWNDRVIVDEMLSMIYGNQ